MAWQTEIPNAAGVLTALLVGTVEGGGSGSGSVGKGGTKATTVTGIDLPKNSQVDVSFVVDGMDGDVTDVLLGLYIIHERVGDIELRLLSPDLTSIVLFDNRGGAGDNIGTRTVLCVFDDAAATAIAAGAPPYTGEFRPEQPFTGFAGLEPNGTWKLRVINSGQQAGTLGATTLLVGTTSQESIGGNVLTGQLWPR